MATTESYEVIDDAVTIHRDVRQLTNPLTGEPVGFQRGNGATYLQGDILTVEQVAQVYRDALDDKNDPNHEFVSTKLRKTSDEPGENLEARLDVPFDGYEDMDEDDVVRAMSVLPSATIQRIKRYESNKENRSAIVNYSIGFGEHPDERQNTKLDVPEADENKAVGELTTRNVPDGGPVQHGEGVTGTGEPNKPFGSTKASAGEGKGSAPRAPRTRSGRRPRSAPKKKADSTENSEE